MTVYRPSNAPVECPINFCGLQTTKYGIYVARFLLFIVGEIYTLDCVEYYVEHSYATVIMLT